MRRPKVNSVSKAAAIMACAALLGACSQEQPRPRSVIQFVEDPPSIDAKLVICRADRVKAAEDPECRNARAAANRLAAEEEEQRRARLERESQRQLESIRRQQAASDAQQQARKATLAELAEAKIAAGRPLTADEARAIGIDPATSSLVIGNERSPAPTAAPANRQQPAPIGSVPAQRPSPQPADEPAAPAIDRTNASTPASLSDIRRSLNTADDAEDADEENDGDE
ncbi:MAG: EexN family lipoprotein [Pseudomonadota bacterium]